MIPTKINPDSSSGYSLSYYCIDKSLSFNREYSNASVNSKHYHNPRANFQKLPNPAGANFCQIPGSFPGTPLILINFTLFTIFKDSIINFPTKYPQIRGKNIDLSTKIRKSRFNLHYLLIDLQVKCPAPPPPPPPPPRQKF